MMSDQQSNGAGGRGRRGKRFLSPSEKYEIWLSLVRGEYTIAQTAGGPGRSLDDHEAAPGRSAGCAGRARGVRPGVRAGSAAVPERRRPGRNRAAHGGAKGWASG